MSIDILFNGVQLTCEYRSTDFVQTARTRCGDDIMPILSASVGLQGEVIRLVKEAHRKEYREEL